MNRVIKKLAIVVLCAGIVATTNAQIVITAADVAAQIAVGNALVTHSDTLTTTVAIGRPGASAWDFSLLNNHVTTTLTSVPVATTPYFSHFPTSTHAFQTTVTLEGITGVAYQYLELGANLLNPGLMGGGEPFPGAVIQLMTTNYPADTTYALPSTYGTAWGSTYADTQLITLNGVEFQKTGKFHSGKFIVDGFGPMTIPGGTVHDALRIRKKNQTPDGTVSYIFLAKDGASVQVTAADTTQPDSGLIAVRSVTWSDAAFSTAVAETPEIPALYELRQNFPNPFNPSTVIRYALPSASRVVLTVYDLLGRRVATLVDAQQDAGYRDITFNASGLASGLYFYRLQASPVIGNGSGFTQTRKLLLTR